jgi:amino acid transporter
VHHRTAADGVPLVSPNDRGLPEWRRFIHCRQRQSRCERRVGGAGALAVDYILNAAVAISAGVGAVASAVPALFPYTLPLCLGILVFLTVLNLRGIRSTGLVFMAPTYGFIGTLGVIIVLGVTKTILAGGHPTPAVALPTTSHVGPAGAVGLWLFLRAFASGCTAMTGVEAVSNGVPLFRKPGVPLATSRFGRVERVRLSAG